MSNKDRPDHKHPKMPPLDPPPKNPNGQGGNNGSVESDKGHIGGPTKRPDPKP